MELCCLSWHVVLIRVGQGFLLNSGAAVLCSWGQGHSMWSAAVARLMLPVSLTTVEQVYLSKQPKSGLRGCHSLFTQLLVNSGNPHCSFSVFQEKWNNTKSLQQLSRTDITFPNYSKFFNLAVLELCQHYSAADYLCCRGEITQRWDIWPTLQSLGWALTSPHAFSLQQWAISAPTWNTVVFLPCFCVC